MRRGVTRGLLLATVLGLAAWPATASRYATLLHPAALPDSECGFPGGQEATGSAPAAAVQTPPVLIDGLGYAGLEPDSRNEEARRWFAQGVRVIWAFDEVEAIRAFQRAQQLDPNCAMCFFGEAWGRAAMLANDAPAAMTAYRKAMERQITAGFGMDPPLFWYSVRRSLAAATLAAGDAQSARAQIYASLRRWPNDALALYVLAQADRAAGDAASADRNLARARALWAGDVTRVPLARI